MNNTTSLLDEIYDNFFKFLAEKPNPMDAIHNTNEHFQYLSDQKIEENEQEIKYRYISNNANNIILSIQLIINNNKYYIISLFLLIPEKDFSITKSDVAVYNATYEQEEFIEKKLPLFVIVPLTTSKILKNINTNITVDFLNQLSYYNHIDDLSLLKDFMYIGKDNDSYLFTTFKTKEGKLNKNILITCDMNIEKHGFITKINNIVLTYEIILENIFDFITLNAIHNDKFLIESRRLNMGQLEKIHRITNFMDISGVIKND